jgi:hypothetical protein
MAKVHRHSRAGQRYAALPFSIADDPDETRLVESISVNNHDTRSSESATISLFHNDYRFERRRAIQVLVGALVSEKRY